MTKQEVKDLCEADPQLQWWAMVLFAEIVECVDSTEHAMQPGERERFVFGYLLRKTKEFPALVVHERLKEARKVQASDETDAYVDGLRAGEVTQ